MKYYIHKITNEPLALLDNTMIDVQHDITSKEYPHLGLRRDCINLCIFPERWCANGVPFHAISFKDLCNFKRISKVRFFELCPDFGQLRHKKDTTFMNGNLLNVPIRNKKFGI